MDRNAESTPPSPPDDAAHRAEPPRTSAIPGARAEIRFEEVDSVERLAAIRGPWTDLWQRAPGATPFSAPAWLLPWCRHLGERPPWAILAWRSRELAAVAPTFLYEERGVRVLALLGGGVSDYQDILAEDAAAATSLLEWLSHRRDRFDRADLRALPPGSPLLGCRVPEAFVGMPAADECVRRCGCRRASTGSRASRRATSSRTSGASDGGSLGAVDRATIRLTLTRRPARSLEGVGSGDDAGPARDTLGDR